MNESGISIDEACSGRAELGSGYFLTDEDFASQCNSDGSVKTGDEKAQLSIANNNTLYLTPTQLYAGVTIFVVVVVTIVILLVHKKWSKLKKGIKK